jgi:hypothetical protein
MSVTANIGSLSSIYNSPYMIGSTIGSSIGSTFVHPGLMSSNNPTLNDLSIHMKWIIPLIFPVHVLTGERVYPIMNQTNILQLMFHMSTWIRCCEPNMEDYGVIADQGADTNYYSTNASLLIKEGPTYDQFKEWWDMYSAKFSEYEWRNSYFPYLKEGENINGYPIKNPYYGASLYGSHLPSNEEFDDWVWINKNTTERIWRLNDYWIFNDNSEMIQYKLTDKNDNAQ